MDSTIITALAIITGTIVGIVGTYFVQKRVSQSQRQWTLEDEERRKGYERDEEQKRIKRELLSKRLDILEEAVKIMINDTSRTLGIELGMPIYSDKATIEERRKRLHDISEEAWATVLALDSKDLLENWRAVSSAYWEQLEIGTIGSKSWEKAQKAYVNLIKLTDEMRSQF